MKNVRLALLALVAPFLVGCVNVKVSQEVSPSGFSSVYYEYDYSELEDLSRALADAELDEDMSDQDFCDQLEDNHRLAFFRCEAEDGIGKVWGSYQVPSHRFKEQDGYYRLDIRELFNVLAMGSNNRPTEANINSHQELGIAMNYAIKMPGTIVSTDLGTIENNKVVLSSSENMFDPNKYYYVVSKTRFATKANPFDSIEHSYTQRTIHPLSIRSGRTNTEGRGLERRKVSKNAKISRRNRSLRRGMGQRQEEGEAHVYRQSRNQAFRSANESGKGSKNQNLPLRPRSTNAKWGYTLRGHHANRNTVSAKKRMYRGQATYRRGNLREYNRR